VTTKTTATANIRSYIALTKPGIIRGNIMTAVAGFLLAARGHVDFVLLFWTLTGTSLVIAAGCVFNNYIDRDIDRKMERTKNRAIVTGLISGKKAIIYGSTLGVVGFWALYMLVNKLTFVLGIVALFFYVVVYGYAKRRSVHGTLIGSIPGAMSLVAGYTAVSNRFDTEAVILFLILAVWQMPHFYAIATYRKKDYAAAGIPVLTVFKGVRAAKIQIAVYIAVFVLATAALRTFGYASNTYVVVMLGISLAWLRLAVRGFKEKDDIRYGKKLFGFSLLVLLVFCLMISINWLLP
jgi:protoheme IX farnesyltransferase